MNMKRQLTAFSAIMGITCAAQAAALTATNTWVGASSGGDWFEATNWSLGEAPLEANRPFGTLHFTNSTSVVVSNHMYFNHVYVENGDLVIDDANGLVKYLVFEGEGASHTDSRIDVAEGASFTMTGKKHSAGTYSYIFPATVSISRRGSIAKYGKGDCVFQLDLGDTDAYRFDAVHVYGGRLVIEPPRNQFCTYSRKAYVHEGGWLALGYQKMDRSMVIEIDKGGVLTSATQYSTDMRCNAIEGGGVVSNLNMYCDLASGPYRFSGTMAGSVWFAPNQTESGTDEEFGLIVGATDTLAAVNCKFKPLILLREPAVATNSCLRFASGIGFFRIRELDLVSNNAVSGVKYAHPLCLADTDGNAVTVRVHTVTAPVCAGPATAEGGRGCLLFGKSQTWNGRMGERTDLGAEANITVTLGDDAVIDPGATLHLAKGSMLDLGGKTVTVSKVVGGGKWRNGKLVRTDGPGMAVIIR